MKGFDYFIKRNFFPHYFLIYQIIMIKFAVNIDNIVGIKKTKNEY
jgi:citrate lyase synthetase